MIYTIWAMVIKDLRLLYLREGGVIQAALLGVVLIFTFSLASSNLGPINPIWSGTIFWICSAFCGILIFAHLYSLEEQERTRDILLLSCSSPEAIWLAKSLAGILSLTGIQVIFLGAMFIFLEMGRCYFPLKGLLMVFMIDWGLAVLGSLFGAVSRCGQVRESLLTTILFPLQIPIILAGIQMWGVLFNLGGAEGFFSWFKMALSFDLIFTGTGIFLFPFLYGED